MDKVYVTFVYKCIVQCMEEISSSAFPKNVLSTTAIVYHTMFIYCIFQGGFEYKKAIVECIIEILEESTESKETGLAHLCEFIEVGAQNVLSSVIF